MGVMEKSAGGWGVRGQAPDPSPRYRAQSWLCPSSHCAIPLSPSPSPSLSKISGNPRISHIPTLREHNTYPKAWAILPKKSKKTWMRCCSLKGALVYQCPQKARLRGWDHQRCCPVPRLGWQTPTMQESPFPFPAAHQGPHLRVNLVFSRQRPNPQHLCTHREFCRRKRAQHQFCPGISAEQDRPNKYHLLFKVQIPATSLNGSIW